VRHRCGPQTTPGPPSLIAEAPAGSPAELHDKRNLRPQLEEEIRLWLAAPMNSPSFKPSVGFDEVDYETPCNYFQQCALSMHAPVWRPAHSTAPSRASLSGMWEPPRECLRCQPFGPGWARSRNGNPSVTPDITGAPPAFQRQLMTRSAYIRLASVGKDCAISLTASRCSGSQVSARWARKSLEIDRLRFTRHL